MPSFNIPRHPSALNVDFYRLHDATPDGVIVARYRDHDIYDVMMDGRGARYVFVGLAPRKADGSYDAKSLKAGEMILEPGLTYQLIPSTSRRSA